MLFDLPAPASQVGNNISQKYYISTLNLWNNVQHNAQPASDQSSLGDTFVEKTNINPLQPFEGDYILEGRFGNTLRFGSSVKLVNNNWSDAGDEGDPITILTNAPNYDPKSLDPYIENINNDGSSIYLTSKQRISLTPDRQDILNGVTKPLPVNKYFNKSQLLFNSDRLVLNSKKDEVMIFAKTNIELNTNNVINLNANGHTHINSPKVNLGTNPDGTLPTEPLLLGGKTHDLLLNLCRTLQNLAYYLSVATATEAGSPLPSINDGGTQLFNDIEGLLNDLDKIQSTQNFTV